MSRLMIDIKAKIQAMMQALTSRLSQDIVLSTTKRASLFITQDQLAIVLLETTASNSTQCLHAEVIAHHQTDLFAQLSKLVKRLSLREIPLTWLLAPEDYEVFLIESLPVPKQEFQEALNWRIRSLLAYPIEDALIEYFNIPPKKIGSSEPMLAVVTACKTHLLNTVNKLALPLKKISIIELALRNLTYHLDSGDNSVAMMFFHEKTALLALFHEQTLYFTRYIKLPLLPEEMEVFFLEIIRYFDYYQSQWRLPTPVQIYALAKIEKHEALLSGMSQQLERPVIKFPVNTLLEKTTVDITHPYLLLCLASLLEKEVAYA